MRNRLLLVGLVLLNLFLGYRLLFSEQGVFAYLELRAEYREFQEDIAALERENQELSQEIRLLKTDRAYVEKTIRELMKFVKKDEVLYVFPDTGSDEPGLEATE